MSVPRLKNRRGYSLMELVIAMSSATLLMTGLASTLLISSSAFQLDSGTQAQKGTAAEVQADMMADLQHALGFTERTTNAVTFTVPDRNNDGNAETIRYAWSGTLGDPLTYSYNGGTAVTLADNVQAFDLSYLTRTMQPSCQLPTFQEFTETKLTSAGNSISIATPAGAATGDLLIAVVATEGRSKSLAAPAGWTLIGIGGFENNVTLGVWWKTEGISKFSVDSSSTNTFVWPGSAAVKAYGWVMRLTGHNAVSPINAQDILRGNGTQQPPSPTVTTTVADTLILRLGAFHLDGITLDDPGLAGHTAITMDGTDRVSGGAGYIAKCDVGSSGASSFQLTQTSEYVTITIAIAPQVNNKIKIEPVPIDVQLN